MKEILVSGSTAFDTLMHYNGNFETLSQNGDISSLLHMSIICESHEKFLGGTGLNIAYNLALLGENPILLSAAGTDFVSDGVIDEGVNMKYFHKDRRYTTAGSIITSDNAEHKISIFYPGAMSMGDQTHVSYVTESLGISIVSANHIPAMLNHAQELQAKNIPFFVDPAQQITAMSSIELQDFLNLGTYLIANEFEFQELQNKSGYSDAELGNMFEKIIITQGSRGSELREGETRTHIPAIPVDEVDDETGAGDAYRAGLLKGVIEGHDWQTSCQIGTILASYCIQVEGAQNHHVSLGNISEDMKTHFGKDIDLYIKRKY
ncbi:PfkB family carbohydrate kinase [Candidatus Gracilibacteria bacterium]|nr:PfkB family carbohydrate kinase [Candidatus Gracilibacteria bacterium]